MSFRSGQAAAGKTYEVGDIQNVVFGDVCAVNTEAEMLLLLLQAFAAKSLLLGCWLLYGILRGCLGLG